MVCMRYVKRLAALCACVCVISHESHKANLLSQYLTLILYGMAGCLAQFHLCSCRTACLNEELKKTAVLYYRISVFSILMH